MILFIFKEIAARSNDTTSKGIIAEKIVAQILFRTKRDQFIGWMNECKAQFTFIPKEIPIEIEIKSKRTFNIKQRMNELKFIGEKRENIFDFYFDKDSLIFPKGLMKILPVISGLIKSVGKISESLSK